MSLKLSARCIKVNGELINFQGNRIKICNFAQVVAYMCYLKMHKTIFSLCFSCHYNF